MRHSIKRLLKSQVEKDLGRKMVFLAGPRQVGKTTLALEILRSDEKSNRYINWDTQKGREACLTQTFPSGKGVLILDEIHKYPRWRNLLKGLYDSRKSELKILVTGSAKLDQYRKGGDSLQGRYHFLRLHPLAFWELPNPSQNSLLDLLNFGGFPEPYSLRSESESRRWSRDYRSRVIREELTSLENVLDITAVEEMALRLPDLVGSPLSLNGLREDLGVSHVTVARWVHILENLYQIFRVSPFGSPRIKALKKESKHYHFDWNLVQTPGARFENFMGSHFLNICHWLEDTQGYSMDLRYFRDREQREVDFVIIKDRQPILAVECKTSSGPSTASLRYLKAKFPKVEHIQVTLNPSKDVRDAHGIRHCDAKTLLSELPKLLTELPVA